ncbi:FAD-dependent oxidoreductase [bacterium]|nr:FAD-dependent oxidoreductase [candidate division CSSED10-310 bacterium]
MSHQRKVIVVGAGPAGLGVAGGIRAACVILEKQMQPGGLMRSKTVKGYVFDWAGHIFFTRINRIRDLIEELQKGDFHYQDRESWIFSKNTYSRYPFQANTFGLPLPVVKECLMGLIEATYSDDPAEPTNFEQWIYKTYGSGIASHFMIPYNRKLWARDLSEMDHHWLADRVPRPGLSEFIDGALGPGRKDLGPNARFGYPLTGGMQTVADRLALKSAATIEYNTTVTMIDPVKQQVITQDKRVFTYDHLVLTCPLHEIVDMTRNIPDELRQLSRSLEFLSVLCVNVGIRRSSITEKHWIYFPEPEFLFHRVFVQGNAAPQVCPQGCFSFTAEITYNSKKEVDINSAGLTTLDGLIRAGLLNENDPVDVVDLIDIPVAYIVPTHERNSVVSSLREWYKRHNIHLVGRFAEWEYYNMDHAIDAGWTLAEELNQT